MNPSGYSGKPLNEKLGYQPGDIVFTQHAPAWFLEQFESYGITNVTTTPAEWAHVFCTSTSELIAFLQGETLQNIRKGFWVSWPKQSSGVETDLTEQTFRDLILPLGWVDTKVCSIDKTWSALKFLRRRN